MILVTGGTGELGAAIVQQLAGEQVRVMSRSAPRGAVPGVEWRTAQLDSGAGLAEAVAGVEAIVHAAFSATGDAQTDVVGTQRLLSEAKGAGVKHFVYVSIVGIEKIPNAYYRQKLAAEAAVVEGGVPWTIQRVTQFHSFVDKMLKKFVVLPVAFLPTALQFQTINTASVAERFCSLVAGAAQGRASDLGGPQVLSLGEMARPWLAARTMRRPVVSIPAFGKAQAAIRLGGLTCPGQRVGPSWAEWLGIRYG